MKKRLLALCLCAALVLSLGGCRYSDVLAQIIYDMRRGQELDFDADFEPEENDPENEDTSDDLKDLSVDEQAERITEENPEIPLEEAETESETDGVELEYYPEADTEHPASAGEDASAGDGEPSEIEDQAMPEPIEAGEGGEGFEADASLQTSKQVVDAYGHQVEIPENVDTVAAVDSVAVMVMMLDGPERLAAVNDGLTGNAAVTGIFPGLAQIPGLWSGEGGTALRESDFQELLSLAPDVVVETSGSATVTDAQAAQLAENGIAYLVLPEPVSANNACTIMSALGTVLGDRSESGGVNAPERAAGYASWVNRTAGEVSRATGSHAAYSDNETGASAAGTYTLYVDGWDDGASYKLFSDRYVTLSGSGCAIVKNGATTSCKAVTSYLALANVVNTAAQYGIIPKTLYFTPLISAYRTMDVTGSGASGMVTSGQKLLEQTDGSLGTANFPILLAADQHTAEAIAESELWEVYPHINSGDGSFNSDGFLDEEGNLVRTQISGEYEIVVNPRGVSSWTEGSAESILEAVWAAWRFFDAIDEDEMRGYISDFYSLFYGYVLSEAEIDRILEGQ